MRAPLLHGGTIRYGVDHIRRDNARQPSPPCSFLHATLASSGLSRVSLMLLGAATALFDMAIRSHGANDHVTTTFAAPNSPWLHYLR